MLKEHLELQKKRDKGLDMPMNGLTRDYINSLGRSELEKKLEKEYESFTLSQFLNHIGKK